MRVEIEAQKVDETFEAVATDFRREAKLPGFRPGKAPREMVLRMYEKDIQEETKRKLISEAYRKAHVQWLRAWVKHLAEIGVGYDGYALYPVDEPGLSRGLVDAYLRTRLAERVRSLPAGKRAARLVTEFVPLENQERARILRDIAEAKNLSFRNRFLGRVLDGITLAREETMGEAVVLTGNYIHARIHEPVPAPNHLVKVRIEAVGRDLTLATLVA